MQLHQQGKLEQAAQAYKRVLAKQPNQLAALQGLAGVCMQRGDPSGALRAIERALKVAPGNPDILEAQAQVLLAQKAYEPAIAACRSVLSVQPGRVTAWYNLGVACQQVGQHDSAVEAYEKALSFEPGNAQALNNLANLQLQRGEFRAAVGLYQRALALQPQQELFRNNLEKALHARAEQQLACNEHEQARESYLEILKLSPRDFTSQYNLGMCYQRLGRPDMAARQFEKVLEVHPERTDARQNLGHSLRRLGRPSEAAEQFRAALDQKPDDPILLANLAGAENDLGDSDAALKHFEQALAGKPDDLDIRSNYLLTMNYLDDVDASQVFEAHRDYGRLLESQDSQERRPPDPRQHGPVRIGLVSADLRRHSVAYFLEPLLGHLDQQRCQVHAYFNHYRHDATSERLKARCAGWRAILGETDEAVAQMIAEDQIDVLIDLSGHSGGNRLPLFTMRPAPVQATWLGYPNTTGLAAMDYRLTDAYTDPPGEGEALHSEKLVRLPGHFSCFSPPEEAAAVAPAPNESAGHITFGSFNNLAKVTPRVLETWATVLLNVPGSRLLLKTRVLADKAVRERIIQAMQSAGVDADRIEFLQRENQTENHLARYDALDIALDPFPYNGTTTTCEALWCGVPVIALRGSSHRARVSASFLEGLGLTELVATSPDHYVALASGLAADTERLGKLRAGMRERMLSSPLMDGETFASGFADAVDAMVAEKRP